MAARQDHITAALVALVQAAAADFLMVAVPVGLAGLEDSGPIGMPRTGRVAAQVPQEPARLILAQLRQESMGLEERRELLGGNPGAQALKASSS